MENDVLELTDAGHSNDFSVATLTMNETVTRLRMLAHQLAENHLTIDTVYAKVSLGGLAKANSRHVQELVEQVEVMSGLCWAQISAECSAQTQLDAQQWQSIGQTPPGWLRDIFGSAGLMTGMPDEASLANLLETRSVLVVRDAALQPTDGVLPQVAALLPKGFSAEDARIWWPWMMGAAWPVLLVQTENPWVLQEMTLSSLQAEGGAE